MFSGAAKSYRCDRILNSSLTSSLLYETPHILNLPYHRLSNKHFLTQFISNLEQLMIMFREKKKEQQTTHCWMPRLGHSTRHCGHSLPMRINEWNNISFLGKHCTWWSFFHTGLHQISKCCYTHLRKSCIPKKHINRHAKKIKETNISQIQLL
jgi:hypothetical protein